MTRYEDLLYPLAPDVSALVVMATQQEYGEHLKALGITPLITGVGPVHAAIVLTHALVKLAHGAPPRRPDVIINLGSAGSATLEQGKVYRVARCIYRDMDASPLGFPKGQTPFSPHPVIIEAAAIMPDFPAASCSTGADVISDHAMTDADLADMEYAALNDVAMRFGIALIGFKGISDGAKPLTGKLADWTELLPVIDRHLAAALAALKDQLAQGRISKDDLMRMPRHWGPEHATFRG